MKNGRLPYSSLWRLGIFAVLFLLSFTLTLSGGQRRHRLRPVKADVTEKKITKKALPAEVLKSFEEKYPHASIKGQTKEIAEGAVYYEIESVDDSRVRNVLFKSDGTVVEIEEGIPPGDLPQFVHDSIQGKYPGTVISSAERTTRDSHIEYELILAAGKKKMEVVVNSAGKIFKLR